MPLRRPRRTAIAASLLAALAAPAVAQQSAEPQRRPIVVELFTSQSCSSCPPADALLTELARTRPGDVLPLTFHVTYWNGLGWRDPFSFAAATERQRAYAGQLHDQGIYTPQMVVDGTDGFVGSDRGAAAAALRRAEAAGVTAAPVRLSRRGDTLVVEVGAGTGQATLLLLGFDREHRTAVGGGENGGRRLLETNVVRSIGVLGAWSGKPARIEAPAPAGEDVAALLQAPDGRIIGAARLS